MPKDVTNVEKPLISVDRASKTCAVFDGFELVRDFVPYRTEDEAISNAKKFLAPLTKVEPEIVYPYISKMVLTTSRR